MSRRPVDDDHPEARPDVRSDERHEVEHPEHPEHDVDEHELAHDEHDLTLADDVLASGHGEDAPGGWDRGHPEGPGVRVDPGGSHPAHGDEGHWDLHHDDLHHDDLHHRHRSPLVRWGAVLAAIVVVVAGGYYGLRAIGNVLPSFEISADAPSDYEGAGSGEVTVEIPAGAGGGQIGQILADADVVASAEAFATLAAADPRSTGIQPGTYSMAQQMSSSAALERLVDPASRLVEGVTIREGLWKEEVWAVLAEGTDTPLEEYQAVDPADLELPEAADGSMEGFLYPDTYEFPPDATAAEQLQTMIDLGVQRHADLGIPEDELRRTIIVGSLVQAEGYAEDELPMIAEVVENRLEEGMPLGFDSTIHFMFGERGRAGTTDAQRQTEDSYNTYLNPGLPPGPINSPGAVAIEAALNPEEGPWLYFVTVDPSTGETKFAETFEEHQANVAEFQQWCRDNPDQC